MSGTNTSVFDMSKTTITEDIAKAFTDDAVVPIKYREGLGNIGSSNFLPGIMEGQEQILVIGSRRVDIQQQLETKIRGHETRHIDQGRKTVVTRPPTITDPSIAGPIDAADDLEVKGSRKTLITINDDWNVMGACIKTIHGGEIDNNVTKWLKQFGDFSFDYGVGRGSAQVFKGEASFGKLEINGEEIIANVAAVNIDLIAGEAHGCKVPLEGLEAKLHAFMLKAGPKIGLPPCLGTG
jgi:hypothetical protein